MALLALRHEFVFGAKVSFANSKNFLLTRVASLASYFDFAPYATDVAVTNLTNMIFTALAPFIACNGIDAIPGNPQTFYNSSATIFDVNSTFFLRGAMFGGLNCYSLPNLEPNNNTPDTGMVNDLSNG